MSRQELAGNNNQVPPGYKQTEVGVIPEDWEVVRVGDLEPYVTSGSRGWAKYYSKYGASFIRITNLNKNSIYLNLNELKFVALPNHVNEGKRTRLKNGDILISITADIGIIGYINSSVPQPAYINQHISLVRFDLKNIVSKYIAYFLVCEKVQRFFRGSTDQGAKAGINLDKIRSLQLAIPPLPEQKAIASVLSDVDELISSLDKLIAKKRHIKTATMQQLLTGKTRLPGFGEGMGYQKSAIGLIPEDWEVKTYGDIFLFLKTANNSRADLSLNESIKYIHYGDIHTKWQNKVDLQVEVLPSISPEKVKSIPFLEDGDIVVADASEDYEGIGKSIEVVNICNTKAIAGLHTILLRDHKQVFVYGFRGYLHTIKPVKSSIDKTATGLKVYGLSKNNLKNIYVPIPPLPEQKAIASVLSDMDKEIAALEKRRAKTQAIKQGMMQELLTGRTRLIKP